jgi:hypothetical protein
MSVPEIRSAPPYVQWSSQSVATVGPDAWALVFPSMQALKGHVQEYPGCQKLEAFVEELDDGSVRIYCYTTWDTPEALGAFLERGYTFERMLVDVAGISVEPARTVEKIF